MAGTENEVLDQWDDIEDAAYLQAALEDACNVSSDHGCEIDGNGVGIHVVPCVPGEDIPAGARVSGMKVVRIDGVVAIYLFAEAAS